MKRLRLTAIPALLLLAAAVVDFPRTPPQPVARIPLSAYFQSVAEWRSLDAPMDDKVIEILQLDDYVSRVYHRGQRSVELYIGFYQTGKKTAAVHSPLVCFPGQGWTVGGETRVALPISNGSEDRVNGTMMTARRENNEVRILYWYQAWTDTYPDTFRQKLRLFWDRVRYGREENALVRISASIHNGQTAPAEDTISDFLSDFYPRWHSYLSAAQ